MQTDDTNVPLALENQLCYTIYTTGIAIQRLYKPLLDKLGLTYPQYLVLNVLWQDDGQTVKAIADRLALESSTLTPLLKRMEAAGLLHRSRNPENEREVLINLTDQGTALRGRAGCLGESLRDNGETQPGALADINAEVRKLRNALYEKIDGWRPPD